MTLGATLKGMGRCLNEKSLLKKPLVQLLNQY